jgi:hypothetical protein
MSTSHKKTGYLFQSDDTLLFMIQLTGIFHLLSSHSHFSERRERLLTNRLIRNKQKKKRKKNEARFHSTIDGREQKTKHYFFILIFFVNNARVSAWVSKGDINLVCQFIMYV